MTRHAEPAAHDFKSATLRALDGVAYALFSARWEHERGNLTTDSYREVTAPLLEQQVKLLTMLREHEQQAGGQ